jgi:hypothetical protein
LHLFNAVKDLLLEPIIPDCSVEPLNISILLRLARLDIG